MPQATASANLQVRLSPFPIAACYHDHSDGETASKHRSPIDLFVRMFPANLFAD